MMGRGRSLKVLKVQMQACGRRRFAASVQVRPHPEGVATGNAGTGPKKGG